MILGKAAEDNLAADTARDNPEGMAGDMVVQAGMVNVVGMAVVAAVVAVVVVAVRGKERGLGRRQEWQYQKGRILVARLWVVQRRVQRLTWKAQRVVK